MPDARESTLSVVVREVDGDVSHVDVIGGPANGQSHAVTTDPLLVGSGEEVDVCIPDPSVSRIHCRLSRRDRGVFELEDLGSTNGSWVGGCRVFHGEVHAGARIVLGESAIELRMARRRVEQRVWTGPDRFGELIGASAAMHRVFADLARILEASSSVLITGESGTGKELAARAIHDLGRRRAGPFVVVDGTTLSKTLADVELFGHAKGAFTDAAHDRPGAFERADGGTLFLDEVGEVPLGVQPKLLRAVDRGEVQRVGEGEFRTVDVQLLTATHRDLERMVNDGTFRPDLYHRLNVVRVRLPPLRERQADVRILAHHLLAELQCADGPTIDALERALDAWKDYRWPGNVRELRSFVRRVALLGQDAVTQMTEDDDECAARLHLELPYHDAKARVVDRFSKRYISRLLEESGGNIAGAARRAGLSRGHLSELVSKYRLKVRG